MLIFEENAYSICFSATTLILNYFTTVKRFCFAKIHFFSNNIIS